MRSLRLGLLSAGMLLFGNTALAQQPPPPAFCQVSIENSIACTSSADCVTARNFCTRDVNPQLKHAWPFGRCIDTTGALSATHAIQADLCTIPHPQQFGGGIRYDLPTATTLKIDDVRGAGTAITIWKKTLFFGNGATIRVPSDSPTFVVLRIVVPLKQDEFKYPLYGTHAAGSHVEHLAMLPYPLTGQPNQYIGILVQAPDVSGNNFYFTQMGKGLELAAPGGSFNANQANFADITGARSWGATIHLWGADANAGMYSNVKCYSGNCILNRGFSTNTFYSPMCEGTGQVQSFIDGRSHCLTCENGAACTVVGGYREGPANSASDPNVRSDNWSNTYLGGVMPWSVEGPGQLMGNGTFRAWIRPNGVSGSKPSTDKYNIWLGRDDAPLAWRHEGERFDHQLRTCTIAGVKRWCICDQLDPGCQHPVMSMPFAETPGYLPGSYQMGPRPMP